MRHAYKTWTHLLTVTNVAFDSLHLIVFRGQQSLFIPTTMFINLNNNFVLNIFVLASIYTTLGVWSSENSNDVVFQFPDYDYKETAKNVNSKNFIDFSIALMFIAQNCFVICILLGVNLQGIWIGLWTEQTMWDSNICLSNPMCERMYFTIVLFGNLWIRWGKEYHLKLEQFVFHVNSSGLNV